MRACCDVVSLCEATVACYSEITAIYYPDSQLQCYIDSNLSLSKAEDWAAVDSNAFSLIWFVLTKSWTATFSSNNPVIGWWLADKPTPYIYNLKCLSWSWEDQAICFCVLYLHIHPIHTQLSFHTNSYPLLYHHCYFCVNVVILLVTHKTTRSWGIEISTYLAIMFSPWQFELLPSEFLPKTPCLNEMIILSLSSLRCTLEVQVNYLQFIMKRHLLQPLLTTQLLLWTQASCSTLLTCYRLKILSVLSSRTWLSTRWDSTYQNPTVWKIGTISVTGLNSWKITSVLTPIQFSLT